MIILMEDKEDDVLSILFRYSLAEEMKKISDIQMVTAIL